MPSDIHSTLKPTPYTSGLRVLKIMVRGSDSRWQRIDPMQYLVCNDTLCIADFPVNPTDREVTVVIFPANYFDQNPTDEEVGAEIARRNLTRPDRAITETTFDAIMDECENKLTIGVCGVARSEGVDSSVVGYVYQNALGRYLNVHVIHNYWYRHCRFLAVVSEEQL
jgi:hypothetical protein